MPVIERWMICSRAWIPYLSSLQETYFALTCNYQKRNTWGRIIFVRNIPVTLKFKPLLVCPTGTLRSHDVLGESTYFVKHFTRFFLGILAETLVNVLTFLGCTWWPEFRVLVVITLAFLDTPQGVLSIILDRSWNICQLHELAFPVVWQQRPDFLMPLRLCWRVGLFYWRFCQHVACILL